MQCKFQYRKVEPSEYLEQHILKQIEGIARFLMKEGRWSVEVSKKNNTPQVIIKVSNPWSYFSAIGTSSDFYLAVDAVCTKLITQIKKKKNQLQYHKKPHKSREGHLSRLNSALEYFPENYPNRKAN